MLACRANWQHGYRKRNRHTHIYSHAQTQTLADQLNRKSRATRPLWRKGCAPAAAKLAQAEKQLLLANRHFCESLVASVALTSVCVFLSGAVLLVSCSCLSQSLVRACWLDFWLHATSVCSQSQQITATCFSFGKIARNPRSSSAAQSGCRLKFDVLLAPPLPLPLAPPTTTTTYWFWFS